MKNVSAWGKYNAYSYTVTYLPFWVESATVHMLNWLPKAGYYNRFSPKSIGRKALFIRAIDETSLLLEYATDRLRRDKEVVLHAVKKEGSNIEYAAKTLKGDKEIAEIAINSNSPVLKYMSKELQNDKDFVLKAIKKNPKNYKFVSDTLKKDRDVVFTAILFFLIHKNKMILILFHIYK